MVDPIRGAVFQTRYLLLALGAGEPLRIAKGLALEAAYRAAEGARARPATDALLARARELAERVAQANAIAFVMLMRGASRVLLGDFVAAVPLCDQAATELRDKCAGVAWELDNASYFSSLSLLACGRIRELGRRLPALLEDARAHGDHYGVVLLRLQLNWFVALASDDVAAAAAELDSIPEEWGNERFLLQHAWRIVNRVDVALYAGDPAGAVTVVDLSWAKLQESMLLRGESLRVCAEYAAGRAALAAALDSKDEVARRSGLERASRAAKAFADARWSFARGFSLLLEAGVASVGALPRAPEVARLYETAAAELESRGARLHALAAHICAGRIRGGTPGASSSHAARRSFARSRLLSPQGCSASSRPRQPCSRRPRTEGRAYATSSVEVRAQLPHLPERLPRVDLAAVGQEHGLLLHDVLDPLREREREELARREVAADPAFSDHDGIEGRREGSGADGLAIVHHWTSSLRLLIAAARIGHRSSTSLRVAPTMAMTSAFVLSSTPELLERVAQVDRDRVEVGIVQASLLHQLRVCGAEVLACVSIRSAEGRGHERDLLLDLRAHVHVLEEVRERRIGHHLLVEGDHRSLDRSFPADPLEQRRSPRFHTRILAFSPPGAQLDITAQSRTGPAASPPAGRHKVLRRLGAGGFGACTPSRRSPRTLRGDRRSSNFGNLSRAADFGIKPYAELAKSTGPVGLQAHHIIPQRFAALFGQSVEKMASVAVTTAEHQIFTNAWRQAIPYGSGTAAATQAQVLATGRAIYAGYPALLEALGP